MEKFILFIDKKTDSVIGIKDLSKNITFYKGESVFLESFSKVIFIISNILLPINGSEIILVENLILKSKILVDPKRLIKIQ
ncbi:hypothetical protein EOM09_03885 [bacterium]|nr:hypothetical protein [bacterium]